MSGKIKSVTVLTNIGEKPILESGTFGAKKKDTVDSLMKNRSRQPQVEVPNDEDEGVDSATTDVASSVERVVGKIFDVPNGESRVLMWLNYADLTSKYLVKKGPMMISESASDEQVAASAGPLTPGADDLKQQFIRVIKNAFSLDDVTDNFRLDPGDRTYCVLLNVPQTLIQKFHADPPAAKKSFFGKAEDPDKQALTYYRGVLAEMLSHTHYVGTLDVNEIKKSGVGSLASKTDRIEKFNVKTFVKAWSDKMQISAARQEHDEEESKKVSPTDDAIIADIVQSVVGYVSKELKTKPDILTNTDKKKRFQQTVKALLVNSKKLEGKEHLIAKTERDFVQNEAMQQYAADEEQYPGFKDILNSIFKVGLMKQVNNNADSGSQSGGQAGSQGDMNQADNKDDEIKLPAGDYGPHELARIIISRLSPESQEILMNKLIGSSGIKSKFQKIPGMK